MLTETDVMSALTALSNDATLATAIHGLQMNHAPKHLTPTHVMPVNAGFGASFFMKKRMVPRPVQVPGAWGKGPTTVMQAGPSNAFGDYEDIDRNDEKKILQHIKNCDFGAWSFTNQNANSFIFFTEIPSPYVGFDWMMNKCLPIEGGYLAVVIAQHGTQWKIITAYPCSYAFYSKHMAKVIHKY